MADRPNSMDPFERLRQAVAAAEQKARGQAKQDIETEAHEVHEAPGAEQAAAAEKNDAAKAKLHEQEERGADDSSATEARAKTRARARSRAKAGGTDTADGGDGPGGPGGKRGPAFKAPKGRSFLVALLAFVLVLLLFSSCYIVREGELVYISQFGKITKTVESAGLHLRVPFIQEVHHLTTKLLLYDVSPSEVLTADKKAMIVDSYVLWSIDDALTFYRSVGNINELQKRLDASVYSIIKNIVGGLQQSEIISDEEGTRDSLNSRITKMVATSMTSYGIQVHSVEIRRYDLPSDNMSAVFNRMISERQQIAASFKADGAYEAAKIRNNTDKQCTILLGEAKAQSEKIRGEAEESYMATLSDLFKNKELADFYRYMLQLEAMQGSLQNGATVIMGPDAPLNEILNQRR